MLTESSEFSQLKVHCTFIPLPGYSLLIPNAAVAEIIYTNDLKLTKKEPEWYAGSVLWNETSIPIIYFERLEDKRIKIDIEKHIVSIIRNPEYIEEKNQIEFFGILSNQVPQVLIANNHTLEKDLHPENLHTFALNYVTISDKSALIPDICSIATHLQAETFLAVR